MAGGRGAVSLEPVSDLEEEPDPVTGDLQLIDDRVNIYHIIAIYLRLLSPYAEYSLALLLFSV